MSGGYNVGAGGNDSNRIKAERDIGVGVVCNVMPLIDINVSGNNGACDVGVGGNASSIMANYNNSNGIKNNNGRILRNFGRIDDESWHTISFNQEKQTSIKRIICAII